MPSIGILGGTLPLGPKSLKVKSQAFPQDGSTGLKWPNQPACHRYPSCHGAGAKGTTGCGRVSPRISWLTQALPMLSLPSIPETSPPKPVPFWVLQEKQLQMIHPRTSLLLGWTNIYPEVSGGTWILPYWEEISSCLQTLAAIAILIEDAHVYLWRIHFDIWKN